MDLNVPQILPGFVLECPGGSEGLSFLSKETPAARDSTLAVHILADVLTVSTSQVSCPGTGGAFLQSAKLILFWK